MKRKIAAVLLAGCLMGAHIVPTNAQTLLMDGKAIEYNLSAISLYVNNEKVETKVMEPILLDGRVLVPAREVFEAMGAKVSWDNGNKKVTIEYKGKTIVLIMNQTVAMIDGKPFSMDVPGKLINDKVMIPVRFVSEAMGFIVNWDASLRRVTINEPVSSKPDPVPTPEGSQTITGQTFTGQSNTHSLSILGDSQAVATIQKVEVTEIQNIMEATISSASELSEVSITTMPGKLVVDIKNSKNQLASQMTPGTNTYVRSIRTSQFTADTTRIVFDLKSGAVMTADLSSDRKQLKIQFAAQNVEEMSISSTQETDKLYFKGLSAEQIQITQKAGTQKLEFTLPNMKLQQAVNWTDISSLFIERIVMSEAGNDVQGIIELKQEVSYSFETATYGTYLVLKKDTTTEGGETSPPVEPGTPEEEVKPEETTTGLRYVAGNKPKLILSNMTGLTTSKIKVTDDYRNRQIIFDLGENYSSVLKTRTLTLNDSVVKTISISNPGTTKITVNLQKVYAYNLIQGNNEVTLELVKPNEKFKQIVVIDIGHGGSDSGAVANGLKEKEVNFNQGMALYKLLEADSNIKVYMTRETDVYPTLQFRADLANEIGAHLFISLHNNSGASTAQGAETLYYPSSTDTRGKAIAQLVQNSLVNDSKMVNRGIKARSDLYVLKNTNMPAILIETGFLTNTSDANRINTSSFIATWAKGVYNAIVQGFKLL